MQNKYIQWFRITNLNTKSVYIVYLHLAPYVTMTTCGIRLLSSDIVIPLLGLT